MDIVEGFDHPNEHGEEHEGDLYNITIRMRDQSNPDAPSCEIKFVRKHHMGVCVNLIWSYICEMYGQGYISG